VFSAEDAAVGEERGSADLREPHRRAEHRDHRRVPHVRHGAIAAGKSTLIDFCEWQPQLSCRTDRSARIPPRFRDGKCRKILGCLSLFSLLPKYRGGQVAPRATFPLPAILLSFPN